MKSCLFITVLAVCLQLVEAHVFAQHPALSEMGCSSGDTPIEDQQGICNDPDSTAAPADPESSLSLLLQLQYSRETAQEFFQIAAENRIATVAANNRIIVYFFWGMGCPHCAEEKTFLDDLKRHQPSLEIRSYEVWHNREHAKMLAEMLQARGMPSSGVPLTFVADQVFTGFTKQTGLQIEKTIEECSRVPCRDPAEAPDRAGPQKPSHPARPIDSASLPTAAETGTDSAISIPLLGDLDTRNASLPVLTLVIAGMDSFNPCAFFVLLSLLSLLIHARSRQKMLLVGGIFVFFSGFIYFLFMAAWLNLFLVMGHVALITTVAGCVSVIIAGINIKDFFLFKQGVSLTIPDSAKPKLFDKMRTLLHSTSLVSIMIGTSVLAVAANFYELLCTAGFPMVFTRILTLNNLSTATYYLYLVLYNIVYIVPLFFIVLGFTITLGKRQLSEWQGRVLKLISGTMMLGLGVVLLVNPVLLNSVWISFIILVAAVSFSLLVAAITKTRGT